MATQPTEQDDISDADLDAAVASGWGEDDTSSTETPEPASPGPAAVEADDTPDPQPDNSPAGDATPEPEPAAQPVPETASAPPEPVGTPFQFKAGGRDHTLAYARQLPDGSVVIPPDAQADFRRELGSARELQTNFQRTKREYEQRLRQAQTQRTEKDAEADAVSGLIADFFRLPTPEERFAYLSQMEGNFPAIQMELERRKIAEREKLLLERERGPQLSPEEEEEDTAQKVEGELATEWQRPDVVQHPDFKLLTDAERQQLTARWAKRPAMLVRTVRTQEEARQLGENVKVGDKWFDPTPFWEDVQFLIAAKKQNAATKPATKAAAENARRNADQQQPAKPVVNAIPPVPRPAKPQGQPRDTKTGQFKTASDRGFRDYFMSDKDEDDAA